MMKIDNNASIYIYILAFIIPLLYFLNLNWDSNSVINKYESFDMYFGADVNRVTNNLEDLTPFNPSVRKEALLDTTQMFSHYRDRTHPYFSIAAVSVSKLGAYFGFGNMAFPIYKLIFGTLGVFLFWLFIYKNTSAIQAFASVALLFTSMSFRIWTAIPETFLFSFFSLMLALNLMRLKVKPEFVLLSTLAGTVTNLSLGLVHLVLTHKNKLIIFKTLLSFALIAIMISIVQQSIYPTSTYFFDVLGNKEELSYVMKDLSSIQFRLFDFFMSGFIVPLNNEITLPVTTNSLWQRFFSVEFLASKRMMLFTTLTIASLFASYLVALYVYFKNKQNTVINQSILAFIMFELILHLFYGDSPFLYSLNFTPFLIIFLNLNQPEKLKPALPYVFIYLAFMVQRFNFSDPNIFAKYFF